MTTRTLATPAPLASTDVVYEKNSEVVALKKR